MLRMQPAMPWRMPTRPRKWWRLGPLGSNHSTAQAVPVLLRVLAGSGPQPKPADQFEITLIDLRIEL